MASLAFLTAKRSTFRGESSTPLPTPTNLVANASSPTTVAASWNSVPNAVNYRLQRAENSTFTLNPFIVYEGTSTDVNSGGFTPGQTYYFRVQALGDQTTYLNSAFSSLVALTTPAA